MRCLILQSNENKLSQDLLERVLLKLGINDRPKTDLSGLKQIYRAWCQHVPFDNSRKLIHRHQKSSAALPGSDEIDFFESHLKWGTGGTCWAGNGALQLLLAELGYSAVRGVATMLVAPHLPPNHGTVIVKLDNLDYLVDASILQIEPIKLAEEALPSDTVPWVKDRYLKDGHWHINWVPMHRQNLLDCRVDYYPAKQDDFIDFHERTRDWSPFNFELNSRKAFTNKMTGICFGQKAVIDEEGLKLTEISKKERDEFLVEVIGLHPELVAQIPEDSPTPPPPGSRTAAAQSEE